jgi:hypothetical protein
MQVKMNINSTNHSNASESTASKISHALTCWSGHSVSFDPPNPERCDKVTKIILASLMGSIYVIGISCLYYFFGGLLGHQIKFGTAGDSHAPHPPHTGMDHFVKDQLIGVPILIGGTIVTALIFLVFTRIVCGCPTLGKKNYRLVQPEEVEEVEEIDNRL